MPTIRDRFWLWGMKVNALQETSDYAELEFGRSSTTVEEVLSRTGARNVILAGGLSITRESLDNVPSARRVICKTSLHRGTDGGITTDYDLCLSRLLDAKSLASADARIEGFLLDDFSTGSMDCGATPALLSKLLFENAVNHPQLPLGATIYTMSLERPELPAMLQLFSYFLVPLWHADQVDTVPGALDRLSELAGSKPMMLCLYVYDFGNTRPIPRALMQRQLDIAEELLCEQRITGLAICGTCMMDLDWESNRCLYEWLDRVGEREIGE